jgi:hypothetical protein
MDRPGDRADRTLPVTAEVGREGASYADDVVTYPTERPNKA